MRESKRIRSRKSNAKQYREHESNREKEITEDSTQDQVRARKTKKEMMKEQERA